MSGELTDALVIAAINRFGSRAMTYVIANILGRRWPTANIRRHLKDMEKRGLVERVSTGYAVQICWSVKAEGLAAPAVLAQRATKTPEQLDERVEGAAQ